MADVRSPSGDATRPAGDGRRPADRGQLLLVGALALAVTFVSLALLLNTAIYTGNLATRDAGVDAAPTIEYVSESRAAGVDAVRSVNYRNNTSHTDLNAAFNSTVDRWDDLAAHHRTVAGDVADADVVAVTNGTRIQQDDASRNFTSAGGDENWTVASGSDLSGVRSMRLTVEESTLASDPSDFVAEDVFHVNVTSDAGDRSLFVYNNTADTPEVRIVDNEDGSVTTCTSGDDGTFVVDVSNGTVGGTSCPNLTAVTDVGNDTSIDYRDGNAAGGTYTMVIDEPAAANDSALASPGSGEPYSTPAVYGAEFRITYRTSELDYEARIGVVPR